MKTNTLFRPVGLKELELIVASGYRAFPPRLEWQPIFYPVLNVDYAAQIAREWNTDDALSGYSGFVTSFKVDTAILDQYDVQNVGGADHNELWIPAERLAEFNAAIAFPIEVVNAFFGPRFKVPENKEIVNLYNRFK